MEYFEAVASQPAALERSAVCVRAALSAADLAPWRTGALGVVAMGANTHASHALVDRFVRHGRPAFNFDASTLMDLDGRTVLAHAYVFISEGGRSRETVEAAQNLPVGIRLGLTNVPESPFGEAVDLVVPLDHGPDSGPYTVGYTATLQALALLATAIDGEEDGGGLDTLPGEVDLALKDFANRAPAIAERLAALDSVDFVGRGASLASATEGALLFREAPRMVTAAFETFQYLHGPMEALGERRGCVVIGSGREVRLANYLAERGIFTVLITNERLQEKDNLAVVPTADQAPIPRAILEMVPIQLLAGELAHSRGLPIDGFVFHQDDTKIPE